jgi:hypothetical protein
MVAHAQNTPPEPQNFSVPEFLDTFEDVRLREAGEIDQALERVFGSVRTLRMSMARPPALDDAAEGDAAELETFLAAQKKLVQRGNTPVSGLVSTAQLRDNLDQRSGNLVKVCNFARELDATSAGLVVKMALVLMDDFGTEVEGWAKGARDAVTKLTDACNGAREVVEGIESGPGIVLLGQVKGIEEEIAKILEEFPLPESSAARLHDFVLDSAVPEALEKASSEGAAVLEKVWTMLTVDGERSAYKTYVESSES